MTPRPDQCDVRYGRQTCTPFKTGIEGAVCVLIAGHSGPHAARIVTAFGETPGEDRIGLFEFVVTEEGANE